MELKAQREDQANLTADVTGLLVQMQRDRDLAAARRRKDELRMTIGAVGQGIEVLASIAFATNPETRDKIIAGSRAAVTVLDSATILSDSAASNGEQAIATMNIYGAFFQLGMILWGPEREDPIAHNFRVLIVGLQNLHKHVDRRFDRLEGLMLAATKQLNDRFDQVEVKLSDLRQKVVQLHEQAAINAGLAKSYLTYLSSRDFKVKQRNCFQGLTSLELTLREYGTCLSTFLDYALEFSEIDAATGRAVYAPALTDASLAATLVAPAALYDVGLLFAALENAAARLNSDLTLARLNPSTWVDGARAYNNILKRAVADAPRLSRKPQQIVTEEAANVRDIVNGGHRLNESVSLVSANALPLSMKLYEVAAEELIKIFVILYIQDMLDKELGVFDRREERNVVLRNEEDTDGYDGRHWFRVRVYSRINWVGHVAPFKDQRLFAEQIKYRTDVKVHMPQFKDAEMLRGYGEPQYMWQFPLSQFAGEIPVSVDDIRRKRLEVNQSYLDNVGVTAFTPEAEAQSKKSRQVPLRSPSLASSFAKLRLAKSIAKKAVTVMWRPHDQALVDLYVAIDALPDTPDALFQALEKELVKPVRPECRTIGCVLRELGGPLLDFYISDSQKHPPTPGSYLTAVLSAALTKRQEFVTAKSFVFGGSPTRILPVNEQINALRETCGDDCNLR